MELKALILLVVCLSATVESQSTTGKVKHPSKKRNDKHQQQNRRITVSTQQKIPKEQIQQLQQQHRQQILDKLRSYLKQDQLSSQSMKNENTSPSPRHLSNPLVLSPENLNSQDFNPALSIALPPKEILVKENPREQKASSDLQRRQTPYHVSIAALLDDALDVTAVQKESSRAAKAHVLYNQPQTSVYRYRPPVLPEVTFLHKPPQSDLKAGKTTIDDLTLAIAKKPVTLNKQHTTRNVDTEEEPKNYAAKYQFGYRVVDTTTGNDFGQAEARDGALTTGHYHVLLPDGRLQTVRYWSNESGFHSHISYDRSAVHN